MPHDVVVVGATARVNQKQTSTNRHPMLLRVVATQRLAVIESPFTNRLEVDPVLAPRDVSRMVGTHRQEVLATKLRERRFVKAAALRNVQFRSVFFIGQRLSVETASHHHAGVVVPFGVAPITNGQKDVATRQVDALSASGIGPCDWMAGVICFR